MCILTTWDVKLRAFYQFLCDMFFLGVPLISKSSCIAYCFLGIGVVGCYENGVCNQCKSRAVFRTIVWHDLGEKPWLKWK